MIKVIFDIDDVLADFVQSLFKFTNESDRTPPKSWYDRRIQRGFDLIKNNQLFWQNHVDILNKVPDGIEVLAYVSARPISSLRSTIKWIIHNNYPDAPVYCIGDTLLKKSEIINIHKPDIFVDDGPHNIEEVSLSGFSGKCLLYSRPHNEYYKEAEKIYNLNEILKYEPIRIQ